jgi:hypothetical protein
MWNSVIAPSFSVLDRHEWLATCPGCFTLTKQPSIPFIWEVGWDAEWVIKLWGREQFLAPA